MSTNDKQELIVKLHENIVQLIKDHKNLLSDKDMRIKLRSTTNEYATLLQHLLDEEDQKSSKTYYQLLELLKIIQNLQKKLNFPINKPYDSLLKQTLIKNAYDSHFKLVNLKYDDTCKQQKLNTNMIEFKKKNKCKKQYIIKPALRNVFLTLSDFNVNQKYFTLENILQYFSKYIITHRNSLLRPDNIAIAHVKDDLLGTVFQVPSFHKSQSIFLIKKHIIPIQNSV